MRGTLLRYVAIGSEQERVTLTLDACDPIPEHVRGMVQLDFNDAGECIGVRINKGE